MAALASVFFFLYTYNFYKCILYAILIGVVTIRPFVSPFRRPRHAGALAVTRHQPDRPQPRALLHYCYYNIIIISTDNLRYNKVKPSPTSHLRVNAYATYVYIPSAAGSLPADPSKKKITKTILELFHFFFFHNFLFTQSHLFKMR